MQQRSNWLDTKLFVQADQDMDAPPGGTASSCSITSVNRYLLANAAVDR